MKQMKFQMYSYLKKILSLFLVGVTLLTVLSSCQKQDSRDIKLEFTKYLYHKTFRDMSLFDEYFTIINDYYNELIKAYNSSDKKKSETLIFNNDASKKLDEFINNNYEDDKSTELLTMLKLKQLILSTDYCIASVRFNIDDEESFKDLRQSIVDMYEYVYDEPK